jgi:predicted nucleic acid-binding protein
VLLNLIATDRIADIADALGRQFAICTRVRDEVKTLRDAITGEMVPIDLTPIISTGTILVFDFASPAERDLFVQEAAIVDDGEAMSIAIAVCREHALAIDDRKATNHLRKQFPQIELWSTPRILKHWGQKVSSAELARALRNIETKARYRPPKEHNEALWWNSARNE